MPDSRKFATSLLVSDSCDGAAATVVADIGEKLGANPNWVIFFASGPLAQQVGLLGDEFQKSWPGCQVLGVSVESAIGCGKEVEFRGSITLLAATTSPFEAKHIRYQPTPDGAVFLGLSEDWFSNNTSNYQFLFGDPFSFPADLFFEFAADSNPELKFLGGMASAGHAPHQNQLYLDGKLHRDGALAVKLPAEIEVQPIISQGCRPIGETYIVTKAERNIILGLGGKPALAQLSQLFRQLPTREQRMMQQGLHLGIAMSEYRDKFAGGDFLIRNVINVDQESEAVLVGDYVRVGKTVQFHLRDAETADAELQQLLKQTADESTVDNRAPEAALLFSCNGRGTRLFPTENHDAGAIDKYFPNLPVAGFFAAGEIGPVGKQNFVHGFTAVVALLKTR